MSKFEIQYFLGHCRNVEFEKSFQGFINTEMMCIYLLDELVPGDLPFSAMF